MFNKLPFPSTAIEAVDRALRALVDRLLRFEIVGNFFGSPAEGQVPTYNAALKRWEPKSPTTGGGLVDGDYGDITVSSGGTVMSIDSGSHTHSASEVTDFSEAVDDRVAALLVAGSNITLTYNDGANSLTIDGPQIIKGQTTVTVPATLSQGEFEHEETVSIAGITSGMTVIPSLAVHSDGDENNEELLDMSALAALAGTGQITFRLAFAAATSGPIKLNYMAI